MRRLLLALLVVLVPMSTTAQDAATLIADSVAIQADSVLVAEGGVEVLYRGQRLQASRVTFDSKADRLVIDGPIVLTDAAGTRVLARQADLSADLEDGLLTGARLVLGQQLQLAADELQRIGGRYTELGRTVASSCSVCAANPTPLWEIRARRVVHDEQERQIYFEGAQLRVGGLPVFYLPRLRMPDPGLERTSGFLTPSIRSTSQLGTGINLPYFLTLGDSRDITVTPYVSTRRGRALALRYREAFANGRVEFNGAIASDEILDDSGTRGYLFGTGSFTIAPSTSLFFGLQTVSDNGYLRDYGISDQDTLTSYVGAQRVRRDQFGQARVTYFESLRDLDDNSILPSTLADALWIQRFTPPLLGGVGALRYQASASNRTSQSEADSNGDGTSDGRDVVGTLVRFDWRRDWMLPGGVIGSAVSQMQADFTAVQQDPAFPNEVSRLHGSAGVEFRWPLTRTGADGSTQVLEPVVQLVASGDSIEDVPNEDSLRVEFDEGNLFSLNRFPGTDAVELGNRAAVGLSWTRFGLDGSTVALSFGKVLRADDLEQFAASSGLDGTRSDWLVGMRIAALDGLSLTQRLLLDDDLEATTAEARLTWALEDLSVTSGYYWSIADAAANRPDEISELTLAGDWRIDDRWSSRVGLRHDFVADRASRASVGLVYRNECLLVDLSLSRWFADSTSVEPTTEFGLAVDLLGFGGGATPGPARRCRS